MLGHVFDVPEGMTPVHVQQLCEDWGLDINLDGITRTCSWAMEVSISTFFTTAIMFTFCIDGVDGVILAVSSALSTNICKENMAQYQRSAVIDNPHWLYYDVWWYAGLALLNFSGILNNQYQGHLLSYQLGQLFDDVFASKMPNWRMQFCIMTEGYFCDSLRHLLRQGMNVSNWLEITTGRSWRAYLGLDL